MKKIFIIILLSFCSFHFFSNEFNIWGNGDVFKLSPVKDSIFVSTSISLNCIDIVLEKVDFFDKSNFNETVFDKNDVNAFDRLIMNPYSKKLDYLGTGFEVLTLLYPSVFITIDKSDWFTVGVIYAETLAITQGISKILKLSIDRTRPYMYFNDYPKDEIDTGDWCSSFPSGHSARSFAAATFTSYVFCKYFPDSKFKIPVIVSSYSLAVTTACLRLASGNHFMTDVITGAVLGSACGFLVPFFHRINEDAKTKYFEPEISPTGFSVKMNF